MAWHAFELTDQHAHVLYLLARQFQLSPDRTVEYALEQLAQRLSIRDWMESANAQEAYDDR